MKLCYKELIEEIISKIEAKNQNHEQTVNIFKGKYILVIYL